MHHMEHIWTIVIIKICKHTFYAYLSQIWKMMQYTHYIRIVFASKILLSRKILFFFWLCLYGIKSSIDAYISLFDPLFQYYMSLLDLSFPVSSSGSFWDLVWKLSTAKPQLSKVAQQPQRGGALPSCSSWRAWTWWAWLQTTKPTPQTGMPFLPVDCWWLSWLTKPSSTNTKWRCISWCWWCWCRWILAKSVKNLSIISSTQNEKREDFTYKN